MRKIIIVGVLLCVGYFVVGLVAVHYGLLHQDTFNRFASLVGGLASILGLLAFVQPRLTTNDLRQVQTDALSKASHAVEELQLRESQLAEKGKELDALELRRAEMEVIARRVSLVQFLLDKKGRIQEDLVTIVRNHSAISVLIAEISEIDTKLEEIDEELEGKDEEVQLIISAIEDVGAHDRYSRLTEKERKALELGLSLNRLVEGFTNAARVSWRRFLP